MKVLFSILAFPLKVLSVVLAAALALSYLAIYISPTLFWPIAYFGLLFPAFLVANLLLMVFWAIARSKIAWLHLVVLLMGVGSIGKYIQWNGKEEVSVNTPVLKVATYNVFMFGYQPKENNGKNKANIAALMMSRGVNIACFQEFYDNCLPADKNAFGNLASSFIYSSICPSGKKGGGGASVAIFSAYPFIKTEEFDFAGSSNLAMCADIKVGNDTIRLYNVHLQSIKLNPQRSMSRIRNEDKLKEELTDVIRRLKRAFIQRAEQVKILSEHMAKSPYPVVVCGDFNDTPMSYTYNTMLGNLHDSYTEAGNGIISTYPGFYPGFRIDNIFLDKKMNALSYEVRQDIRYSDHFPVFVDVLIGPKKQE